MVNYIIRTENTIGLSTGLALVYGGKSGFTAEVGVVELICNSYTVDFNTITLQVSNLHFIYDDFLSSNVTSSLPEILVKIPTTQFSASTYQQGAVGYTSVGSYASMTIKSIDVAANTITVADDTVGGFRVGSTIMSAPLRLKLYQPVSIDNRLYIAPTHRTFTSYANIKGATGTYVASIRTPPKLKKDITVYLDDVATSAFTWPVGSNTSQVSVDLNSTYSNLTVSVLSTLPPAIEPKDLVALPFYNNTYTVADCSYISGTSMYNASMLASNYYAIKINKPLSVLTSGSTITNVTKDAEGVVSNLAANTFNFTSSNKYAYTYKLANSNLYYIYAKNDARFTKADLGSSGKLEGISPGTYLVRATNINRFNRTSPTLSTLAVIEPIKLAKITEPVITEQVQIDTTGGASINAVVSFKPTFGRDTTNYELKHRVLGSSNVVIKDYSTTVVPHSEVPYISSTIYNVPRGAYSSINTLEVTITPTNGSYKGYPVIVTKAISGKLAKPSGLSNFNIAQQGEQVLFSWTFKLTDEGYILDLDTKEVEIREYPGAIDISNSTTLLAAWNLGLSVARIPFPNKAFSLPVSKYGTFTYLLRVRDTSNLESDEIGASYITTARSDTVRLFKAYNEANAAINFTTQDNSIFVNSNTTIEPFFSSFSSTVNGGLVKPTSSNADNSNASATGFSVFSTADTISTGQSPVASYITQIRDMGQVIKGTVRVNPIISVNAPNFTYSSQYDIIFSGVTDTNNVATVLVETAFGGIGTILGLANANAAPSTYDAYLKTLTSGGPYGNVFAIRSANTQASNQNSYALIAGIINANAIALGASFYANGNPTGSNSFANVAIAGNSFQLVNLAQYIDPRSATTFAGPNSTISQNIYVRFSTSNVFYSAASNGVGSNPGHGNTNANAFYGASSNADMGWRNYIAGQLDFRYMQVRIDLFNKLPSQTEILLTGLTLEVDVTKKTFSTIAAVNSNSGVVVDYSHMGYLQPPNITAASTNSSLSCSVAVFNTNTSNCTVKIYNSVTGIAINTSSVQLTAIGI